MNTIILKKGVVSILLILTLISCGGGGESDTENASEISLSTNQAMPGEVITISESSINADDLVDVVFRQATSTATAVPEDESGAGEVIEIEVVEVTLTAATRAVDLGYPVTVKAIAIVDGEVSVAVPPYIDQSNGEFSSGQVEVVVNGRTAEATLQVDGFLELGFDSDGQVTVGILEFAIEQYIQSLQNLDALALEVPDVTLVALARSRIETEVDRLQAMIDEITFNGTLTIVTDESTAVLSAAQLSQLDVWNCMHWCPQRHCWSQVLFPLHNEVFFGRAS